MLPWHKCNLSLFRHLQYVHYMIHCLMKINSLASQKCRRQKRNSGYEELNLVKIRFRSHSRLPWQLTPITSYLGFWNGFNWALLFTFVEEKVFPSKCLLVLFLLFAPSIQHLSTMNHLLNQLSCVNEVFYSSLTAAFTYMTSMIYTIF